jgi:hypothetical protein
VETSDDFGTRGEPPTHPELLDYLADEFRQSGWDVKRFVKLLLTSDAFRRDARATPESLARDPGQPLVRPRAAFPVGRRADSGQRVVRQRPDRPGAGRARRAALSAANIWEPVGYSDSNTRFYLQDHGPALYRRSLYVFLKRTAPPPFMSNFDGPNREQSCTRRERSNTPLQALQLMNDVQHVEAARALAERALCEGGDTPESRVAFLYRTVLSRLPTETKPNRLGGTRPAATAVPGARLRRRASWSGRRIAAASHRGRKRTAAWTMIANLILNTDETLNRN